jgi:hypothetical protein
MKPPQLIRVKTLRKALQKDLKLERKENLKNLFENTTIGGYEEDCERKYIHLEIAAFQQLRLQFHNLLSRFLQVIPRLLQLLIHLLHLQRLKILGLLKVRSSMNLECNVVS